MFLKLMLVFAFLGCVSVGVTAMRKQIALVLELKDERVPLGDDIRVQCISSMQSCGHRSHLYKVMPGGQRGVLVHDSLSKTSTQLYNQRCVITTEFSVTASEESNGTYTCSLIDINDDVPETISDIRAGEVTVHVCQEPTLTSSYTRNGSIIVVNATEHCGYNGEITWQINGRPIPRRSTITTLLPAIEKEDDTLVITNTEGCGENVQMNVCNVTAEFVYIFNHRERILREMKEISGCCIDESIEVATETPKTESPESPKSERELERSKLSALKKEVLELKKEALPLQIRLLQRLNEENAHKPNTQDIALVTGI